MHGVYAQSKSCAPGWASMSQPNKTRCRFEILNADLSLPDVCEEKLRRHLK